MSLGPTSERVLTARQAQLLDQVEERFLVERSVRFTLDELADRLHCSKSSLSAPAGKEQPAVGVVRHFYRRAVAVRELDDDGVAAGRFRRIHPALVADTVTTLMFRVGRGETGRATGSSDAAAYRELVALLLHGISR